MWVKSKLNNPSALFDEKNILASYTKTFYPFIP
jgi:hypothetical protein